MKDQFVVPAKLKNLSFALMGIGVLTLLIGLFTLNGEHAARFWGVLLQNSVFFLLICLASLFFICATTLAQGGWQVAFKRVNEAIALAVPYLGIVALVVLLSIVFGHKHEIYHWLDKEAVAKDEILKGKSAFLNPGFYTLESVIAIAVWSFIALRIRKMSLQHDAMPRSLEGDKKFIWNNTVIASIFIVFYALTIGSTLPWLWLMSIDAHWYSTMYSWYTFASSFVSGMALIALFVIYLKNQGYLEFVNEEHLHDIGKFMFAFSVFWAYLWFSQYMLIWYANIPEETIYFKPRVQGPYRAIFFINLIMNFVLPLLLLMTRNAKRKYTSVAFMAVLIIVGHWIDFFQMVMPGTVKENYHIGWFEVGIAAGFVGLVIFLVANNLAKAPLTPKHHPFLKESIIHHT